MSDFMGEWCDKAPADATVVVMDSSGMVTAYSGADPHHLRIRTYSFGKNTKEFGEWTFPSGYEYESELLASYRDPELWKESKRVRTPEGWVKA